MRSTFTILAFIATVSGGCFQSGHRGKDVEVLTGSPWKYEKAGFDDDDGTFDALDPHIAGSEKDNIIIFCKDGTGYSRITRRTTAGNPDTLPFIWAFQNNDSTIYFQDQYFKVKMLTQRRLEMVADQSYGRTSTRYTIILKR